MIERALAVSNGKGGVGKTSVAAGTAGCLALGGWRVLVIDLDPQANISDELGVDDDGATALALKMSCMSQGAVPIEPLVARSNLHLIASDEGEMLELADWLTMIKTHPKNELSAWRSLSKAIGPLTGNYDVIIIDTPPAENSPLARLALANSHWVVSPAKRDYSSMKGIARLADIYRDLRVEVNPGLEFLGAILFDLGAAETAERRAARASLEEVLGGQAPVFNTIIPSAPLGSTARNAGLLSYEYAAAATEAKSRRLAALRRGERPGSAIRFGANASALSDAYRDLTAELVDAMFKGTAEATPPSAEPEATIRPSRRRQKAPGNGTSRTAPGA
jgi:chromosome partitioning protein